MPWAQRTQSWSVFTTLHCELRNNLWFSFNSHSPSSTTVQTVDKTILDTRSPSVFRLCKKHHQSFLAHIFNWLIQSLLKLFLIRSDVLAGVRITEKVLNLQLVSLLYTVGVFEKLSWNFVRNAVVCSFNDLLLQALSLAQFKTMQLVSHQWRVMLVLLLRNRRNTFSFETV